MTHYAELPHHPLCNVPQCVLDVARAMMHDGSGALIDSLDVEPVADAIVMALHVAGYVTWPGKDQT